MVLILVLIFRINAKQQQYPVLFLCLGLTTRYEPFVDLRASSSNSAVNFAASLGILVNITFQSVRGKLIDSFLYFKI